jgi:hypothetical protein
MTKFTLIKFVPIFVIFASSNSVIAADWQNPADKYKDAHTAYDTAECPISRSNIQHFVYFARDRASLRDHVLLTHPAFSGAQIMYQWAELETARDQYDFSIIKSDIEYLKSHGKKLFIQIQDATFYSQYQAAPNYLLSDEFDGGAIEQRNEKGAAEGWAAKRWNPKVRDRFAKFLHAMGTELDGKIAGVNLQETALSISQEQDPSFSHKAYFHAIKANMLALKKAFPKSTTIQYANFMPGEWLPWEDEGYLKGIYRYGEEIGVGLGGPDLMFTRRGQLNHTIAMMHEGDFSVPLSIAIQDGNYIGYTGADGSIADAVKKDRKNIVPKLYEFAKDFMGVDYMFWVDQAPYFEEDVLSCLSANSKP